MIPKKIWTVWFGDTMPDVVKKSIQSQHIAGYEHFVLNENSVKDDSLTKMYGVPEYIKIAIEHKKWVKATDYLRAWVLNTYGGIFLDADQEILPNKNFDDLLHMKLFAAREENGFIGFSLVGSEPNHPIWDEYFRQVNAKFTPLDGKNFESSMEIFTHLMYGWESWFDNRQNPILSPDYFFPYNHQTGKIQVTDNTRTFHHFMKTWTDISPDILPTVSIIIPQLGRPDGLQRCLNSIDGLYYPKHLIEVMVEEGPESVPVKVERAFKRSKGQYLIYAANDVEFTPESLYNALTLRDKYDLIAFNTGDVLPDEGNICEHFVISKTLANYLGGIFDTDFNHVGVDNLLWARSQQLGKAVRAQDAVLHHYHFSKGSEYDEIYQKGWALAEKDRLLLKQKLEQLYARRT